MRGGPCSLNRPTKLVVRARHCSRECHALPGRDSNIGAVCGEQGVIEDVQGPGARCGGARVTGSFRGIGTLHVDRQKPKEERARA